MKDREREGMTNGKLRSSKSEKEQTPKPNPNFYLKSQLAIANTRARAQCLIDRADSILASPSPRSSLHPDHSDPRDLYLRGAMARDGVAQPPILKITSCPLYPRPTRPNQTNMRRRVL